MSHRGRTTSLHDIINSRQQEVLRTLWVQGRLSRWELHEHTGLSPNNVGSLVDGMLRDHLIQECAPEQAKMGRPRVPLEIAPGARHILGLALVPGRAEITRFGLNGEAIGNVVSRDVPTPSALVDTAAALLTQHLNKTTLAIGVTSTGFLDPARMNILLSSALPGRREESLQPIFDAANGKPAILQNDSHALAAHWLLTHRAEQKQDVLLVWFSDGRFGSALLIDGRPNRGCMTGGNELGHTRFPGIETEPCFCGQTSCLERIFSSDFLSRQDRKIAGLPRKPMLNNRIANFTTADDDPSLATIVHLLAHGLSNAINLLRLHRVVLVSPYTHHAAFNTELVRQIRSLALSDLADRTQIDLWDQPPAGSAENAGWLVLAELMYGGWDALEQHPKLPLRHRQVSIA